MEVFINARTLVDGLRKAGRNVTRETLAGALESMGEKVYGLVTVRFKLGSHDRFSNVGLAISRDALLNKPLVDSVLTVHRGNRCPD